MLITKSDLIEKLESMPTEYFDFSYRIAKPSIMGFDISRFSDRQSVIIPVVDPEELEITLFCKIYPNTPFE
jgi:hypothetical protein